VEGFKADVKADMWRGDRGGEPSRGGSGVIGGIYWVAGPPGFEPGTFGSGGRRSILAELRALLVSISSSSISSTDLKVNLRYSRVSFNDLRS
jgi:hypothetical protein